MQTMNLASRVTSCVLACAITTLTWGQAQQPSPAPAQQAPAPMQQAPAPTQQAPAPVHEARAPTQAPVPTLQGKTLAASAGVLAYPSKGQPAEQQTKDEAECYNWSKMQSGFDPMAPPAAPVQPQAADTQQPAADHRRARGAVGGAAAGAAIGAVAGNAGKGAAIGATTGLLAGGRQSRMAQSQQQEQSARQAQAKAAQAQASQQQLADTFKRGMTVCLEARGYTVKY